MKYIAMTFDDGRGDNYSTAFPILKKYGMKATLFATTGFIDGTWKPDSTWEHAGAPVTAEQLLELDENGWKIGLHGDRHITELGDWKRAIRKLTDMGINTGHIGSSLPDSRLNETALREIRSGLGNGRIRYIRGGRANNVRTPVNGFLFALYSLTGSSAAYFRLNRPNVIPMTDMGKGTLPSVVIRHGDDPRSVLHLLDRMEDGNLCILMMHSILRRENPHYGKDVWNWDADSLETLCAGIRERETQGLCRHGTLRQIVCRAAG